MFKFSEGVIKDKPDFDFLIFRDYFDSLTKESEWLTVHLIEPIMSDESKMFYCVIIDKIHLKTILKKSNHIGFPSQTVDFYKKSELDFVVNYRFIISDDGSYCYLPFVNHRDKKRKYEEQIDIIQDFILYHNLRLDIDRNYVDPATDEVVIRFGKDFQVDVKLWYIKDFLAATGMMLIRLAILERKVNKSILEIYIRNRIDRNRLYKGNSYQLFVANDPYQNSISSLYGKEVIKPFIKPSHSNYLALFGKDKKKYLTFITKVSKNGKRILDSCNPKTAPIVGAYFNKEVLDNYKKNESRYRIENNNIYDEYEGWWIKFGINDEKVVHVLLKALGKLPIEEQYHWKKHNIKPTGGFSEDFFNNQFNLKFTDERPDFLKNISTINNLFKDRFGFSLFMELSGEDEYLPNTILPLLLLEQQSEFDPEIIKLSKLLIDHIDKKSLENSTCWKPSSENENKSLFFLHNFLNEKFNSDPIIPEIISRLRLLQSIRSALGGAHKKSSNYKKRLLKDVDIQTFDLSLIYNKILSELNKSTNYLISLLKISI